MNPFDEQFDDAVRGAFDRYEEGVDPAALDRLRRSLDAAGQSGATALPTAVHPYRYLRLAAGLLLSIGVLAVFGYYGYNRMGADADTVAMSSERGIDDDTLARSAEHIKGDGTLAMSAEHVMNDNTVTISAEHALGDGLATAETSDNTDSLNHYTDEPSENYAYTSSGSAAIDDRTLDDTLAGYTLEPSELHDNYAFASLDSLTSHGLPPSDTLKTLTSASVDSLENHTLAHIHPETEEHDPTARTGPLRAALASPQTAAQSTAERESDPINLIEPIQANRASVVLGSHLNHTTDGLSDGIGISFGALRQWQVLPRVRVVTGGLLAWNQFTIGNPDLPRQIDQLATRAGTFNASIESETSFTTLALEIPLQGVVEVGRFVGRSVSVGVGLTSMVYLSETAVREGVQYQGEVLAGPQGEFLVNSSIRSFETREQFAAFDRIDAGRLLNLSVFYEPVGTRSSFTIELFTKQPLGALTSSEITFGMTGITVRYGIW